MRLLVTGAAGFIGSAFVRMVLHDQLDACVVSLDALTYAGKRENLGPAVLGDRRHRFCRMRLGGGGLQWQVDRVSSLILRHRLDGVVHFAAETHVDRSIDAPDAFLRSNVTGTYALLESIRAAGKAGQAVRLLHVSTDEVYGDREVLGAASERTLLHPSSPYSASKAAADHLVLSYVRTFGLDAVITRCTNNYGPRQHGEKMIPTIIRSVRDRAPVPVYGDGCQARDWIYVDDHCRALLTVLDRGKRGGIYNIGTGICCTNLDLITSLGKAIGEPPTLHHVVDRLGHDRRYAVALDKVHDLGWRPTVTLPDGLARTVEWYRGQA